jgi:hypothetical protein
VQAFFCPAEIFGIILTGPREKGERKMRVEAVRREGGFFIPLNEELKFVSQDRIILDIEIVKPGGFWDALTAFRRTAEKEGIEFSDSDFEGLRDSSRGREEIEW